MGDHYCCSKCHQRYDMCSCQKVTTTERRISSNEPFAAHGELYGAPKKAVTNVQPDLDDIRYFHDKFQKYKDEKSAQQLVLAVNMFLESKGK